MAWLDDRIWAHPKIRNLSWPARGVYMFSIAYSSGFGLYGTLGLQQQKTIGSTPRIKAELIEQGLWESEGETIHIHDWDEHNRKRDDALEARRTADRERQQRRRRRGEAVESHVTERDDVTGPSRDTSRDKQRDGERDTSRARTRPRPMTSDRVTEQEPQQHNENGTADDAAAAAINTLERAGWTERQLDGARADPRRALAWLTRCQNDPTSTNPAGLAWEKFQQTGWPTSPPAELTTIAAGAQGTRSNSPPLEQTTDPLPDFQPPPPEALTALRKAGIHLDDPEPQP